MVKYQISPLCFYPDASIRCTALRSCHAPSNIRGPQFMDLTTFENLQETLKAHPSRNGTFSIEEYREPRSLQVIVRHESRPRVLHHLVIFPSGEEGMVVRKWWTHDHDVGIETPTQGQASPEMILQHIQQLLMAEFGQRV